jgi:predicted porin
MKKSNIALAALALIASTAAMAEGVTVSGYIDAGIQANKAADDTKMIGGILNINHVAFSGSEDLGNGLKAGFLLLTRFESTGGQTTRPTSLFEIANVNLSSSMGTIEMGRTVDAFWGNGVAAYDVTGGSNVGSAVASVLNLGTSKIFVDNSIKYVSPSISGVTVAATYVVNTSSTGATIASATEGDYSATANYAAGPVGVGAGLMKSDLTKGYFIAGGYDAGVAKINAVFQRAENVATGLTARTAGVNTAVPLSGELTLTAGYYKDSGDGAVVYGAGSSTQAGLIYALSKRTKLFANYQHTTGVVGLNLGLSTPTASAGVGSAYTVGLGHAF